MADHSVGARDESHESEASWALMFCFDNVSPEKACFVVNLVCFISLWLRVAVYRIQIFQRSPLKLRENNGSMQFVETKERSSRSTRHFTLEDLRKIVEMMNLCGVWWCSNTIYMASTYPKVKKFSC